MIGNSDDETNFPDKLLLTNRQVANLRKAFANHTSTDIKLSKAQLTKMQKGRFLRFLAPLLKSGLPLLKSVIKPLGMLGLIAAASATDVAIHKTPLGSGTKTLIISNGEIKDILKIPCGFLSTLLRTLASSLLTDMLLSKKGKGVIRVEEGTIRAGYGSKKF